MQKNKKKLIVLLSSVLAVIILLVSVSIIYLSDYYHADKDALTAFSYSENITKKELNDDAIAYIPQTVKAGFLFYPGGKVEAIAYEPLMTALAEKGILSILIEMPFNLAVFDINAADGIREQFSEVKNWYMGGHSLGGSMAASYIRKNVADFDGLILLGSYSTADISKTNLNVISIYGSEDKVLNTEKYDRYKSNLPKHLTEFVIDGGCHAYFGVYGHQDGDGTPTISNNEQISITAKKLAEKICN